MIRLAPVLLASALLAPSAPEKDRVTRRLGMMGTELRLVLEHDGRARALRASEEAVRALEEVEARLSTWREDSELARLNAAPVGERVRLSPSLAEDLSFARTWFERTGGAFDPAVGALVEAWGLRAGGRLPEEAERIAALVPGGFAALELARDSEGRPTAVRTRANLRLEEGGFGKGLGLDRAREALVRAGVSSAHLDLGGQVLLLGREESVALAHPADRERPLLSVLLGAESLATSGNSERGVVVDGRHLGHLLDPRTGVPVPDFGSATAISGSAGVADAFSTAAYVMGPERALAFAAAAPDLELLVVDTRDGGLRVRATAGLRGRLTALEPGVALQFTSSPVGADFPLEGAAKRPSPTDSSQL